MKIPFFMKRAAVVFFFALAAALLFASGMYVGSLRIYHTVYTSEQEVRTRQASDTLRLLYSGTPDAIRSVIRDNESMIVMHYENHLLDLKQGLPVLPLKTIFFPQKQREADWAYGKRFLNDEPLFPSEENCPKPVSYEEWSERMQRSKSPQ